MEKGVPTNTSFVVLLACALVTTASCFHQLGPRKLGWRSFPPLDFWNSSSTARREYVSVLKEKDRIFSRLSFENQVARSQQRKKLMGDMSREGSPHYVSVPTAPVGRVSNARKHWNFTCQGNLCSSHEAVAESIDQAGNPGFSVRAEAPPTGRRSHDEAGLASERKTLEGRVVPIEQWQVSSLQKDKDTSTITLEGGDYLSASTLDDGSGRSGGSTAAKPRRLTERKQASSLPEEQATKQASPSRADSLNSSWVWSAVDFISSNWHSVNNSVSPARESWEAVVEAASLGQSTDDIRNLLCNRPGSYFLCHGTDLVSLDFMDFHVSSYLVLPPSLCAMTTLQVMDFSFNTVVTGVSIPSCLGALNQLSRLGMQNMSLNGSIPESLGNLTGLQVLLLASNNLEGSIPASFSSLTGLSSIQLQYNSISGPLPLFISSFSNLVRLHLFDNLFSGQIPSQLDTLSKLQDLRIDYNPFFGSIPNSLGNLRSLVHLNLNKVNAQGTIPSSLGLLSSLRYLHITHNPNLSGSIPSSFNMLTNLVEINIFWNNLSGYAPACWASFPNLTTMNLGVNVRCPDGFGQTCCGGAPRFDPALAFCQNGTCGQTYCRACTVPAPPAGNGLPQPAITAITVCSCVAGLFFLASVAGLIWWRHRKRAPHAWEKELETSCRRFSWDGILAATGGFSDEGFVGKGGFGSVHRGVLQDGKLVAVKRASRVEIGSAGKGQFEQEVLAVHRLHHKSLVRLLGYCSENVERVLVYELMQGGDLSEHLYSRYTEPLLSLEQRLQVAVDVAEGLKYLHGFSDVPLVHRDIKPANILLDEHWHAKIADFGLARQLSTGSSHHTSIAGTTGYMDPELLSSENVSAKSDVYSFGVVLLELVTGRRCILRAPSVAGEGNAVFELAKDWTSATDQSNPLCAEAGDPITADQSKAGDELTSPCAETGDPISNGAMNKLHSQGQEPLGMEDEDECGFLHISVWAEPLIEQSRTADFADLRVCSEKDYPVVLFLARLALDCVKGPGSTRPTMADASTRLHELQRDLLGGRQPVDELQVALGTDNGIGCYTAFSGTELFGTEKLLPSNF